MFEFFFSPILLVAFFWLIVMVLLIVVFREKQYVWPLESLDEAPIAGSQRVELSHENPYRSPSSPADDLPLTPFAAREWQELEALGYRHLGSFRRVKKGVYRIRVELWISSDRYVVASIDSGRLMTIRVDNLSMFTLGVRNDGLYMPQAEGLPVCVESLTNDKFFSPNVSGMLDAMLFPSASARKLDELHRRRLVLVSPHRFSDDPLRDVQRYRIREAQAGCERGLCRFLNEEQTVWLPTFAGALRIFLQMKWFMLSRYVFSDRRRLKRRLRRYGHPC